MLSLENCTDSKLEPYSEEDVDEILAACNQFLAARGDRVIDHGHVTGYMGREIQLFSANRINPAGCDYLYRKTPCFSC